MGDRAVVIFVNPANKGKKDPLFAPHVSAAIYCHACGSPAEIYGCLYEMQRRGIQSEVDMEAARMTQILGDLLDSHRITSLSLRVFNGPASITEKSMGPFASMADDNGVYIVERPGGSLFVRRFREGDDGKAYEVPDNEVNRERLEAQADPLYEATIQRLEKRTPVLGVAG